MVKLKLLATLTDVNDNPLPNKTIEFYRSTDRVNYQLLGTATTDENGQAYIFDEVVTRGTYYYKARFPGDPDYDASEAEETFTYKPEEVVKRPWWALIVLDLAIKVGLSKVKER